MRLTTGSIARAPPYKCDEKTTTVAPFNVKQWLAKNRQALKAKRELNLFEGDFKSRVKFLGSGEHEIWDSHHDTFLWQWVS